MANAKDFNGKVALITGSTSGIGEGVAIYLSKLGAKVVVTGRRGDRVTSVAKKCTEASPHGYKALGVVADITVEDDVNRLVSSTIDEFGQLDILVNNAGAGMAPAGVESENLVENYDKTMALNLRAVFALTNLAVPHLIKTKGNIINISSAASLKPFPSVVAYCVSKAGLDMFTKCVAIDLGPKGVRVNSINPAHVSTEFGIALGQTKEEYEAQLNAVKDKYPLRRIGEVDDVAKAVAYFASEDASFVTGVVMQLDGGALYAL